MNIDKVAKELAAKANECCHRSDGYEEEMEALIKQALLAAFYYGKAFWVVENKAIVDDENEK